jgi:uncharacterized membrane protein YfcA
MGLSLADYTLVLVAVTLGAMVQGSIGFGAGLVAVPALALVAPETLPVTMIAWAVPLNVAMAVREHRGVDRSGIRWATLGRIPGTAIGVWVVSLTTSKALSVIAGGAVLLAVATSLVSATVPLTPATKTTAGFTSGLMETTAAIGGPPLALLYQHEGSHVLRSTLAVNFILGAMMSVAALAGAAVVEGRQVALALALQPGLALGLALSRPMARVIGDRWLRPTVLGVASVTALMAIIHGL